MVVSIARQAVIIKSKTGNSIILGNYECAYALGLLSKAAGITEDDTFTDMQQWYAEVMEELADFKSGDERLMEILRIMKTYEPEPMVDDQVRQLYRMGREETRMWQM